MKFGIVVFPGTWSDTDWHHAIRDCLGADADYIFHKQTELKGYDCIVMPGGFSYGDYLRPGAIASNSPVMDAVADFARNGGPVIGSCNGFQVLCEAGLLPGALLRNRHLQFRCQEQHLRVERAAAPFTSLADGNAVLSIPVSHGDGNYFVDDETLAEMEANGQILFRYCDPDGEVTEAANPNGSRFNIAGVTNAAGNVLGVMPHPERAVEAGLGGTDGLVILRSIAESVHEWVNA
ncbi:MAG: phosphoribosylformylglycinamidine synthase subunit PurQ [Dehalococcoidia bacterium]